MRIYWPKGTTALGVSAPDERDLLDQEITQAATNIIREELLRRFSELEHKDAFLIDVGLKDIAAPFNERTAASSAVALPRGSRLDVPQSQYTRLFLHWCEPIHSRLTDALKQPLHTALASRPNFDTEGSLFAALTRGDLA